MNQKDDRFLDVLQNIEFGLKQEYAHDPDLTDRTVMMALDNAKTVVKQAFGFARNEKIPDDLAPGVVKWILTVAQERVGKINNLTVKEYTACVDKVNRSVARHAQYGRRGYYEFVKGFV